MSLPVLSQTQVAVLTPPGAGAIATLAVCGPQAWEKLRQLFRPRMPARTALPAEAELGPLWLGRFGVEATDEVVVTVTRTTPVPWIEIHCHGGPEVVRLLVESFAGHGVPACSWAELERRRAPDPFAAVALSALVGASTLRTATILLDQSQGAFRLALDTILAAWDQGDGEAGGQLLAALARSTQVGRHLTTPWRVVVAGAPNVGKSSLVNALAGFPRCVVAATPGTTRDVVTTLIAVEGWPVELADTAGLRDHAEALEHLGMARARTAVQAADLCLWVLDASTEPVWPSCPLHSVCFVINKVDLPAAWDLGQAAAAVRVSARTGAGLADLCQLLARSLVPQAPPAGAAVPFTSHLCAHIEEAWRTYAAGRYTECRQLLESLISV